MPLFKLYLELKVRIGSSDITQSFAQQNRNKHVYINSTFSYKKHEPHHVIWLEKMQNAIVIYIQPLTNCLF